MADKKLNEVTKVTDMAYVPVIMADGSIGQIAKADLATVVAELMGNPLSTVAVCPNKNFNEITEAVIFGFNATADTEISNHPCNVGTLIVFPSKNKNYGVAQVVISNTGQIYARSLWGSWNSWQS